MSVNLNAVTSTYLSAEHLAGLARAIFATLILPLNILALDYFIRSRTSVDDWTNLVRKSGPDCCILSLGTTGAVFLDPTVSHVRGIESPLFVVALMVFLLFMRFACIDRENASKVVPATSTLRYGLWSLSSVCFIMVLGYLVPHS